MLPITTLAQVTMPWSVVGAGGEEASGSNHTLNSTVGQAVIGRTLGGAYVHEIGFWFPTVWHTVSVGESAATMPVHFWLGPSYPNPFNPTTTLDFALAADTQVTLKLYDAGGRLVRTLIDASMATGYHRAALHATGLASGIYYCRMQAGDFTATRQLVLVK
jgi:hypothetical protein